ncbi:MAG TPA: pitrilysin family protein, partial [Pyrinomonadaceae bacterium]
MVKREGAGHEATPVAAGGSATPQELGQQLLAGHGEKSSEAVAANTPASAPTRSNFAARVVRAELPTGAVALVLENHATPTISVRGSLRAGSYFEPRDKVGLARLTADMLERGTLRRTKFQLAGDLEAVGAEIGFSADPFAVEIAGRALAKDLSLLLGTLAEQLREPAFPADELEKLKQQAIAAVQEQQANTRLRAYEKFSQLIYDPANPFYVHGGEQLIKSLNSITVEDVRRFYDERYGGRSFILSVVGDVEAAEVQRLFAEAFGEFGGPRHGVEISVEDPSPQAGARREIVMLKEKANVDVLLGAAAPLRRDASDYYAATLANGALGESTLSSRL